MRGCLFVVVIGLGFLAVGVWFAAPPLAALAVGSALDQTGLESAEAPDIAVTFGSPGELLGGRAERVRIATIEGGARGVSWRAATIELGEVDLLAWSFATFAVDLEWPQFRREVGDSWVDARQMTARGGGDLAEARIAITADQFLELAREPLASRSGGTVDDLRLAAPDEVRGEVSGVPFAAVVRVDSGGLVVEPESPRQPAVELFRLGADVPFRLENVAVEGGDLVLIGTLDVAAMLGR